MDEFAEERVNSMAEAVGRSINAATWLTPSDEAAKELALHYAALLDMAWESGELVELNKAHAVAGPNLQKTLGSLGLTAVDRAALTGPEAPKESKTDELKRKREERRRAAAGAD